jgi:hypothetical protein
MPRVRFEPTTPAFERAKTVLASDRLATVIRCTVKIYYTKNSFQIEIRGFYFILVESFRCILPERFDWAYNTNILQYVCDVFTSLQILLF